MSDLSIERLESDFWPEPGFDSYVVQTCHKARKKPLSQLTLEEIRLLASQRIGLKYILPLVVEELAGDAVQQVSYFEGDLLLAALRLTRKDWENNLDELHMLHCIVLKNMDRISCAEEIPKGVVDAFLSLSE